MKTTLIVILILGCWLLMDAEAGHHGGKRGHHRGGGGMRGGRRGHHKTGFPKALKHLMKKCMESCHDECGRTTLKTCLKGCKKSACPRGTTVQNCMQTKADCMGNCYSSGNVTQQCGECVASCDNPITRCRNARCSDICVGNSIQTLHAIPACRTCMRDNCGPGQLAEFLDNAGDQGAEEGESEASDP